MKFKLVFSLLVFVNLLNFIDRGIIPGSTLEFDDFIREAMNTIEPDLYLGLLQSSFIVGLIIGSLLFGHMIHYVRRFSMLCVGMSIWVFAVFFCGISRFAKSYWLLLIARMISGFGEASLQCTVPPWIEDTTAQTVKTTYLSIFYTAIPVGTALGYTYSSLLSNSIGWQWAYWFEAMLMCPCIYLLYRLRDEGKVSEFEHNPPSFRDELLVVLSRPLFIFLVLGYAAQTATLIGVSTFGSAFMMGLGFFETEAQSSTVFGVIVSIAGIVGTPVGGYLVDFCNKPGKTTGYLSGDAGKSDERPGVSVRTQLSNIFFVIYWSSLAGTIILALLYFVKDIGLYLFFVAVGCSVVFFSSAGITMAVMLAVPETNRSFAVGLFCIGSHIFGDVPSPIVGGFLKDALAPNCVQTDSVGDDGGGNVAASAACRRDADGTRLTMLLIFLWMYWSAVFFALGWYYLQNNGPDGTIRCCVRKQLPQKHALRDSENFEIELMSEKESHSPQYEAVKS